jgi:hypothetical protein
MKPKPSVPKEAELSTLWNVRGPDKRGRRKLVTLESRAYYPIAHGKQTTFSAV